jgi:hypothetical protein
MVGGDPSSVKGLRVECASVYFSAALRTPVRFDGFRLACNRGLSPVGADPGCHEPDQAAPRQLQHHFVVPQPLATLHQAEVPDEAVSSAAHSSEFGFRKSSHPSEDAPRGKRVNS